jgi:hypothetical protein
MLLHKRHRQSSNGHPSILVTTVFQVIFKAYFPGSVAGVQVYVLLKLVQALARIQKTKKGRKTVPLALLEKVYIVQYWTRDLVASTEQF